MERNYSYNKKHTAKNNRAAHSNISALNALRESIEWNEKMREEKKKKIAKEKINDPNWQRKNTFSDSSEFDNSIKQSEEISGSSMSSISEESEQKVAKSYSEDKISKALASNGKVDRINDELKRKHSKIASITKSKKRNTTLNKQNNIK